MSHKEHSRKPWAVLFSEDKAIFNSYQTYRTKMASLDPISADVKNDQTFWASLEDSKQVDNLRNALIYGINVNREKKGFKPLHIILKAKNNLGLKTLLDFSSPIVDKLALTYAQEWHPHIVQMLLKADKEGRNKHLYGKKIAEKRWELRNNTSLEHN